jgi:aspartate-semialdehyde dehydrogenase
VQQLGQLDRVGGGALAQVVRDDPQVERALVAGVAANAPDVHLVSAGGVDRLRVRSVVRIVDDRHAGCGIQELARALDLWIVADNLRKGAATNAVQLAELLHARRLLGSHAGEARAARSAA